MDPENRVIIPQTPRDRLVAFGPQSLSSSELLAVVLGMGTSNEQGEAVAKSLLSEYGGLVGVARLSLDELCERPKISMARATQLQAAFELSRRVNLEVFGTQPQIRVPADAANLLLPEMAHLEQESLRVMLLDTRNYVIRVHEVYKGSLNTCMIRVAEVFREAIRRNSAAVIMAHNHPSGDPTPSPEDVALTREVIGAGRLLDIEVLDHLIIGHGRFVSLKERGLAFG